jgi:E3 ubiquitin-protein ligase DOA10
MQYLHQGCLQRWIKSAGVKSCELCKFEFIMHAEVKPFKQVKCGFFVLKIFLMVEFYLVAKTRYECCGKT